MDLWQVAAVVLLANSNVFTAGLPSYGTASQPTIATPTAPNSQKTGTVKVTNNGPVTLDFKMKFTSQYYLPNGTLGDGTRYMFWWDDDNTAPVLSFGPRRSEITTLYSAYSAKVGKFNMSVTVCKALDFVCLSPLAKGYGEYEISEHLVGSMQCHQSLDVPRPAQVLSTAAPQRLHAQLHDPGHNLRQSNVTYTWYRANDFYLGTTFSPWLMLQLHEAGNFSLFVTMKAHVELDDQQYVKYGRFEQRVTFMNPVSSPRMILPTEAVRNDPVSLVVSWSGSHPTRICWNLAASIPAHDIDPALATQVKMPTLATPTAPHEWGTCVTTYDSRMNISFTPRHVGRLLFSVTLRNDVGFRYEAVKVEIVAPKSSRPSKSSSAGLAVGLSLTVMALLILLFIGYVTYARRRRQLFVEVANFDFRSVDEGENRRGRLSSLRSAVRSFLPGARVDRKGYGAINEQL